MIINRLKRQETTSKYGWLFLLILCSISYHSSATANTTTTSQRVLFVGNSFTFFNNGIHNHLGNLVRADNNYHKGKTRFRSMTYSGAYLSEQQGNIRRALKSGHWNVVVLQGQSGAFSSTKAANRFSQAAKRASKDIRKHNAIPLYFMTWAYENKPEMIDSLVSGYTKLAKETDAYVAPVGLAFHTAKQQYPHISLYSKDILRFEKSDTAAAQAIYKKDIKHPSLAGTYLAACVFYAVLYNKSPQGLAYSSELSLENAQQLQHIAWQSVRQFKASY